MDKLATHNNLDNSRFLGCPFSQNLFRYFYLYEIKQQILFFYWDIMELWRG